MASRLPEGFTPLGPGASPRSRKKADRLADEIKHRIGEGILRAGMRLPQEKHLAAQFKVSKGTIREALKSLEVQGLVQIRTGPDGGARVIEVSAETSVDLMNNYFRTGEVSVTEIYAVRKVIEPLLAEFVFGHLSAEHFLMLEGSVGFCSCHPIGDEAHHMQRFAELDFHDVLADACPNKVLAVQCRMLNDLLKNLPICRAIYALPTIDLAERAQIYHTKLLAAYWGKDRERVGRLMFEHMCEAENLVTQYAKAVEGRWSWDGSYSRAGST
jgi:DNA-binding FadR family transcriptional regulator